MSVLRIVIAVSATTSLVVSLAATLLFGGRDAGAPAVAAAPDRELARVPAADGSELAALRSALERERNARLELTRQIDELSQAIAQDQPVAPRPASGVVRRAASQDRKAVDPESELAEGWFSEQALRDQGMSEAEIEQLRQRFDEVELEKLYARDRAAREGWTDSSRHYQEMRDIQTQFREELGERDYDAVLYASGRNNRVRVQDLLRGSAAANSGVQSGDVILSYAGERVFDPSTLYMWTKEGRAGESVELEVLRGNQIVKVEVPRGPLGGKMEHFAAPPGS
jgi:hypothetical protein